MEDAFYFCHEAKAMPQLASTEQSVQRHLRVCILLSWVGLEEITKDQLHEFIADGAIQASTLPKGLSQQIGLVLSLRNKPPLSQSDYTRLRKLRNDLTHSNDPKMKYVLKLEDALETFNFCFKASSDLLLYRLWHPEYRHSYAGNLR
jgi:hypothetical protein